MSEKLNEITEGSFLRVNKEGKAYWGQSERGGGIQWVTITIGTDDSFNYTYTSSHTGSEITEMAQKGMVMAKILGMGEGMQGFCTYIGSIGNRATFAFGSISNKLGSLSMISVMPDTTAAELATIN